eukprot:scaffold35315_cov51-Phaeocystis_antarctica.AAC.1
MVEVIRRRTAHTPVRYWPDKVALPTCTATKLHDAAISSLYGSQDAEPSPPPITHTICSPHVPCPLDAYVFQTAELHAAVPQYSHSGG